MAVKLNELEPIKKIPTGIYTLDKLTKGGIPVGRFSLFWGARSSAKTTTALKVVNAFLRHDDRPALIIDSEHALDSEWASSIIEAPDRVDVIQPVYVEEAIEELQAQPDDKYSIIVVDSLAQMISMQEEDTDSTTDRVGYIARPVNRLLRRLLPKVSRARASGKPLTVLLINQVRKKVAKQTWGGGDTKPGGEFQNFITSLEVKFYSTSLVKDSKKRPVKLEVQFRIEKNKTGGIPKEIGIFRYFLVDKPPFKKGDTDCPQVIAKEMEGAGLLKKEKGGWVWEDCHYKTLKELYIEIRENYEEVIRKLWQS